MNGMRYQPQGTVKLDRGNPLGAKVIEYISLSSGRALVSGNLVTTGPGGVTEGGSKGRGLRGTGSGARASVPLDLSQKSRITLAFWLYWDAYANNDSLAMEMGTVYGANRGFIVDPNCSSPAAFMFGAGTLGSTGSLATFPRPSAGSWHRIVLPMDRTAAAGALGVAYVDGIAQTTTAFPGATTAPGNFGNDTLNLLSRNGDSLFGAGKLQDLTIYDGILSQAEVAQDWRNPWQIFVDPSDDEYVASAALSYTLAVQAAAMTIVAGQVGMRASRKLAVAPAALTLATSNVAMLASRRLGVQPASMAVAGGQVALRVSRRLSVAPAAMVMTGGQVSMLYAPNPEAGSYTLPVSAAAMTLTGGNVGMRVSRRLSVAPASLVLTGGSVRALVGRRLMVSPAGLQLTGGTVTLRYSAKGEPFDITKIHPSRLVIFEGSGSRITPFEGSGSRITPFEGSGSRITRFE